MIFKHNKENLFDSSLKSGLYLICCLSTKKYYIGCSNHVQRRLTAHKAKLKRQCHENRMLQKDFDQYGEQNFLFQKLYLGVGSDKTELEKLETLVLQTLNPENRYNFYTNWRKRGPETNPFYEKQHTLQARKAQSNAKIGKQSNFANHSQSNRVKQIISQENKHKADRRKPLSIDNIYYESISEASTQTGLARRLIRERCHSMDARYTNYKWVNHKEKNKTNPI